MICSVSKYLYNSFGFFFIALGYPYLSVAAVDQTLSYLLLYSSVSSFNLSFSMYFYITFSSCVPVWCPLTPVRPRLRAIAVMTARWLIHHGDPPQFPAMVCMVQAEAGVLNKLSLAGFFQQRRLSYSWLRFGLASAGNRGLGVHNRPVYTAHDVISNVNDTKTEVQTLRYRS